MTSIILSNRVNERSAFARDYDIYKAWSFKNNLSSNVIIPANSQVALQSCKINVDGGFALNPNGDFYYQYYGQKLGGTIDQFGTTSTPVQTSLSVSLGGNQDAVVNTTQLANLLERTLNTSSHHPNNMGRWSVKRKVNSTTGEFEGFLYQLEDQYSNVIAPPFADNANNISATAMSGYTNNQFYNNIPIKNWIYTLAGGVGTFQAFEDKPYPAVAVLPDSPLSLIDGEFIVDFSDANTKNIDWCVGLTRGNTKSKRGAPNRPLAPEYWSKERGGEWNFDFYADYAVYRYNDKLYLAHTIVNPDETDGWVGGHPYSTYTKDLDYTQGQGAFGSLYDISANADAYTKIKFKATNEKLDVFLVKADNTEAKLFEYKDVGTDGRTKLQNLKPINQACRCLHPLLYVETTALTEDAQLKVERFYGSKLGTNTNIASNPLDNVYSAGQNDGVFRGWWEFLSTSGLQNQCWAFECRNWNNYATSNTTTHNYLGLQNSDKNLEGEPILIVKPDFDYFNSGNANTSEMLGFRNDAIVNTFALGSGFTANTFIQESVSIPRLINSRAIFVRLDNIPTSNINGFKSNKSTILSMIPRVPGNSETGRIFYEPNNLMYVDLQNTQEIRLNNFDISFCNVDETFATTLTGQSVVVLHFKVKGE